jgi:hypothetical protein
MASWHMEPGMAAHAAGLGAGDGQRAIAFNARLTTHHTGCRPLSRTGASSLVSPKAILRQAPQKPIQYGTV